MIDFHRISGVHMIKMRCNYEAARSSHFHLGMSWINDERINLIGFPPIRETGSFSSAAKPVLHVQLSFISLAIVHFSSTKIAET
jgi:hypothetical protein